MTSSRPVLRSSRRPAGKWLRSFRPAASPTGRIIALPHAGGAASALRSLVFALPETVDVLTVQYPGRQDRSSEPLIDDLKTLADHVADEVAPLDDLPLSLFGHSMGATVAYETASRVEQRGIEVTVLFASGRRAPSIQRDGNVHQRDDEGVITEIKSLGGTQSALLEDPEITDLFLPVIRADYRAVETYRHAPGTVVNCPISVLYGTSDPLVAPDEAQAWSRHTAASIEVHPFSGAHFYLDHQVEAVASLMADTCSRLSR
ncbi:alpha/beta fold hydrolase [Nocardiopsis rhodophaea]|uniref:Alpha/beta fold hydrolase n=1 Tax=Nocardiopsis rhodophaea TaxID=280238 RepID=A0ABN2TRB3_9ACTN